ncbi:MAG: NAD(P)-dependent oxidoreductase [Waddliaceae bacterium]
MKILITGSKGLIGAALKCCLEKIGINVLGIDLKHDSEHPDYGDLLDAAAVFSKASVVNGIVHLAAISRVIDGEKMPQRCWETNVEGTQNVINAAVASDKKPWIIYASSREVYGEPKELPVKEWFPLKPINIYGESKVEAEKRVEQAEQKGIAAAIVRLSNVYGSIHDYPDRVIPAFCRAAAEGAAIRVDGKENSFDFTYLDDVINGLVSLIRIMAGNKQTVKPIHLTQGVSSTLEHISAIAQQASAVPISLTEKPSRSFDVSRFFGDPSRAREVLKWQACVSIEEGMHRLIHQFRLHAISNFQNADTHVVR